MRLTVVLTLTFSLVACDDDGDVTPPPVVVAEGVSGETPLEGEANPAETEPAVETPPAEPEDHFVLGPCTASETYGLGNLQDRRGSTGVAFDSVRGGLVIRTKDLDHVEAWRLAASGAPAAESVEVELPGARDIKGLYRVGERFLAVTHTLCADTRHMQKCLHLRALEPARVSRLLGDLLSDEQVEALIARRDRLLATCEARAN